MSVKDTVFARMGKAAWIAVAVVAAVLLVLAGVGVGSLVSGGEKKSTSDVETVDPNAEPAKVSPNAYGSSASSSLAGQEDPEWTSEQIDEAKALAAKYVMYYDNKDMTDKDRKTALRGLATPEYQPKISTPFFRSQGRKPVQERVKELVSADEAIITVTANDGGEAEVTVKRVEGELKVDKINVLWHDPR